MRFPCGAHLVLLWRAALLWRGCFPCGAQRCCGAAAFRVARRLVVARLLSVWRAALRVLRLLAFIGLFIGFI